MALSHAADFSDLGYWLLPIGYSRSDRPRASLRNRVSKTQSARGSTEAACQIADRKSQIKNSFGVVADKQCTCPASKPMREHYPPTPPFHRGENEIQASLISSAFVGATPTPATNFREVIRLPVCKTGVCKQSRKRRLERYLHFPAFVSCEA